MGAENKREVLSAEMSERIEKAGLFFLIAEGIIVIANSGCGIDEYGLTHADDDADSIDIRPRGSEWMLMHIEGVPTLTERDDRSIFPALGAAVDAAIRYLTGEPEAIEDWNVPTHQHPGWRRDVIVQLIASAKHVSQDEWMRMQEAFENSEGDLIYEANMGLSGPDAGEFAATQFISAMHRTDPNKVLWIRRNLKEAFILQKEEN